MFDAYVRRARLAPAALAALPAMGLLGAGAFSADEATRLLGLAAGAVGIVICGLVRDRGRRVQGGLWEAWGGSPTTQRLRFRGAGDKEAVARLHDRIARVLGLVLPTEAEENANPQQAESLYDDAVAALRELTRDRARFRLVFAENAEYGFRRNTFGIKWLGVTVSAAAIGIGAGVLAAFSHDTAAIVRWGVPTGLGAACAAFWLLVVTPDWVRRAAEIYADRLFEAVVALAPPPSA